jgi:signal transduction histidine kinase
MPRRIETAASTPANLAVRLHGAAASLACGIGLLKDGAESSASKQTPAAAAAVAIFRAVLADLKELSEAVSEAAPPARRQIGFRESLVQAAGLLTIQLELEVIGEAGLLAPNQRELIEQTAQEALRNVRRHSGAAACRISLDASSCPFVLRVRDEGRGIQPGGQAGHGLALTRRFAEDMGCDLRIASQPGLGTELTLVGPRCARDRALPGGSPEASELRSEVAEKTP